MINQTTTPNPLNALRHLNEANEDFRDAFIIACLDRPYADSLITTLIDALDRESLTTLCLELSLCPRHFIDYAICFDDDDPECSAIRVIHPNHDT